MQCADEIKLIASGVIFRCEKHGYINVVLRIQGHTLKLTVIVWVLTLFPDGSLPLVAGSIRDNQVDRLQKLMQARGSLTSVCLYVSESLFLSFATLQ